MKRHCDIEDMEYASAWQKAYGVSDDELRSLARHQERLSRFDELPTCDSVDEASAGRCRELLDKADVVLQGRMLEGPVFHKLVAEAARASVEWELDREGDGVLDAHTLPIDERLAVEARDVVEALLEAAAMAREKERLTLGAVLKLHAIAARSLPECAPAGELRSDVRYVEGSAVVPPPPRRVQELLARAVRWWEESPSIERTAGFHLWFEDVHPFPDGNGRTGRVVADFMLMRLGLPPVVFGGSDDAKREYYEAIDEFVRAECPRDASRMANFMLESVERTLERALDTTDR